MDIKIITRHAPSNYGSLLQSIASLRVLEKMNHKCKIIDYIRNDEKGLKATITFLNQKKEWNNNIIRKLIYILLRYPEELIAEKKFSCMRSKFLNLTQRCTNIDDLSKLNADIFMTGSDQVWGPVITGKYDPAYFLSFVKETKKIAYAASFGRTEFNETTIEEYKSMLKDYDSITVREDSAVKLLNNLNIDCKGQVLDPTLLLTSEEWSNYITKNNPIKGNYVLVYQLHNNPVLNNYAIKFAKHVGLPLYRVSPSLHQFKRGGKFLYLPDLGEFLSYIKNCTYFITDSFHGTAFAINFNKQFIEILPNNKTGSRNQSILRLTSLEKRIVTDYNDFSICDEVIDYNYVNNIIEKERIKSLNILNDLIEHDWHKYIFYKKQLIIN